MTCICYIGTYNFDIHGYVPNICCNFIAPTIYEIFVFGFIYNYCKVIDMPLRNTDHTVQHLYCILINVHTRIYYLKTKRYCEIVN